MKFSNTIMSDKTITEERERLTKAAKVANAAVLEQALIVQTAKEELSKAELIMEQLKIHADQCAEEAEAFNNNQTPA